MNRAPILLPTRNRPNSLAWVLLYYQKYYPETRILIADGSDDRFKPLNQTVIAENKGSCTVDYLPYPADLSLFDRLIDVLKTMTDEFVIMGSDDDFPVLEPLRAGEAFLRNHSDYSTAIGTLIHLTMFSPERMNARIGMARTIAGKSADKRIRQFSYWPYSTTYAVTRREHLLERYQRANILFLSGFYDFFLGCHDAAAGAIRALPEITFICSRNYGHSYLRTTAPLIYLRRADVILEFNRMLIDDLCASGVEPAEAEGAARLAINRQVASVAGSPITKWANFTKSAAYQHPATESQFGMFRDIFAEGTPARAKYLEKLKFIVEAMKSNALSGDNDGEAPYYETIAAQLAAAKGV